MCVRVCADAQLKEFHHMDPGYLKAIRSGSRYLTCWAISASLNSVTGGSEISLLCYDTAKQAGTGFGAAPYLQVARAAPHGGVHHTWGTMHTHT